MKSKWFTIQLPNDESQHNWYYGGHALIIWDFEREWFVKLDTWSHGKRMAATTLEQAKAEALSILRENLRQTLKDVDDELDTRTPNY